MKKFIIPFLTVFLLLMIDGFIAARNQEPYIYQNENKFQIPNFQAKDLNGNTVTNDIFEGKFTVVCLWVIKDATDSQKLMADIENLKTSTSLNFRLIGIIGDMKEDSDGLRFEIARDVAKNFPNIPQIIPNDEMTDILSKIRNAPTVFFVNGEGKIIGQPVVGNENILIKKELFRLMNKNSEYEKMRKKSDINIFFTF